MPTLSDCLFQANEHWRGRPGGEKMAIFASRCVELVGCDRDAQTLGTKDAVRLLADLRSGVGARTQGRALSPKSVAVYYSAFRRLLALNEIGTVGWPKSPTPPRKTREAMKQDDTQRLIGWLREHEANATADLAILLRGTGLRVGVEGLRDAAIRYRGPSADNEQAAYGTLHITGKGGNERTIPVVDAEATALLGDAERMAALRGTPYWQHLKAWNKCVAALGINSRLATPHSLRHYYACEALRKSGGNISMVQELLGHSDPATTARYLETDLSAKASALAQP